MLTQKPSNLARPSSTLSRGLTVNVKVTSVEAYAIKYRLNQLDTTVKSALMNSTITSQVTYGMNSWIQWLLLLLDKCQNNKNASKYADNCAQ